MVGVGAAVGLALSALQQNINLFYTPTQIANGEAPTDTRIRAGGLVEKGSLQRSEDSLNVRFVVTDGAKEVTIAYHGIPSRPVPRGAGHRRPRQAGRRRRAGGR